MPCAPRDFKNEPQHPHLVSLAVRREQPPNTALQSDRLGLQSN